MIALYPGSFDPFTSGHLDVLKRATRLFETVIVTVAVNKKKTSVFTPEERVEMINAVIKEYDWSEKVLVDQFSGLLVNHARHHKVQTLIRGVRQVTDFEYEFSMALMNRKLSPEIDTIFLPPSEEFSFVSASLVKEVAWWKGGLSDFLPKAVADALQEKYDEQRKGRQGD